MAESIIIYASKAYSDDSKARLKVIVYKRALMLSADIDDASSTITMTRR